MDTIFKKTEELVRNNPADFQKTTQSITKKILKNNHPLKKSEVLKRFHKIWPDSKGKKVIVIGWLLSDSAIGTGAPSVPTALAEILTERISNADNNLNPANLQEWIRGTIFHQEESKQRLEDAVRAYETENPLKDESAGTAVQQTPAERNGDKADTKPLSKDVEVQYGSDTPVTLREFMREYCEPLTKNLLESRVLALQGLNQKHKLKPPLETVAKIYKPGQSHKFLPSFLIANWPKYIEKLTSLPKLK